MHVHVRCAGIHYHLLSKAMIPSLLLAGPGVILSTALTAIIAKFAFPYSWDANTSLMFGAMLSATDPLAVVALLRELGASKVRAFARSLAPTCNADSL